MIGVARSLVDLMLGEGSSGRFRFRPPPKNKELRSFLLIDSPGPKINDYNIMPCPLSSLIRLSWFACKLL